MSIYRACSKACRELASAGEPFIDIDVVNAAAEPGWSKANFQDAARQANQIVGNDYRNGKLVRYGPVTYEGEKDYVRKAGRVLYADAEVGPKSITTPNGEFGQMRDRVNDNVARVGRRKGARRDDFTPWDQQTPESIRDNGMMVDGRPLHREIERLRAELKTANKRNEELARELDRVREASAGASNGNGNGQAAVSRADVQRMVEEVVLVFQGDMEERVKALEDREKARARVYSEAA